MVYSARSGTEVRVVSGPTKEWIEKAKQDADVLYSGAENMMTDFVKAMDGQIDEKTIDPLYLRVSNILVRPGTGKLPVPLFSAGGIATPADAAMCMQLGAEAVFVGSGIFESAEPSTVAKAIVEAVTHFQDPTILAKVSRGLGVLMPGLEMGKLDVKYADRGW